MVRYLATKIVLRESLAIQTIKLLKSLGNFEMKTAKASFKMLSRGKQVITMADVRSLQNNNWHPSDKDLESLFKKVNLFRKDYMDGITETNFLCMIMSSSGL